MVAQPVDYADALARMVVATVKQRGIYSADLLAFTQRMFPGYVVADHHRKIALALQSIARGETDRLIITMAPRHGKSELASIHFPTWYLANYPDRRIIACSNTQTLADRFSRQSRNKINDPRWPFPDVQIASDLGQVQRWDIDGRRGGYIAAGVGSSITGFGADLILVDDPVKSAAEADSPTYRENTWEWYQGTLRTRLEPGGAIVVIGTRWHEDDLIGRLLESGETWRVLHLPAIDENGAALWPERYSVADLERIRREVGSRNFEAQYQGRPVAQEGGILKRHWFRFWQYAGQSLPPVEMDGAAYPVMDLPGFFDQQLQSWDLSFKETKAGSYVVGLTAGVLGAQCYLLDRYRERTDFPGTVAAFLAMTQRWPDAAVKLVEDKANGPALMDTLRAKVPGIVAVSPDGTKEARMHAASPFVEGGGLVLPHPCIAPWVTEFLDEVTAFPLAAHDDQADALSQMVRRVAASQRSGMTQALASWFSELE